MRWRARNAYRGSNVSHHINGSPAHASLPEHARRHRSAGSLATHSPAGAFPSFSGSRSLLSLKFPDLLLAYLPFARVPSRGETNIYRFVGFVNTSVRIFRRITCTRLRDLSFVRLLDWPGWSDVSVANPYHGWFAWRREGPSSQAQGFLTGREFRAAGSRAKWFTRQYLSWRGRTGKSSDRKEAVCHMI